MTFLLDIFIGMSHAVERTETEQRNYFKRVSPVEVLTVMFYFAQTL